MAVSGFSNYPACADCGGRVLWSGFGPLPRFCGQVCKQRAYRKRKAGSVTSPALASDERYESSPAPTRNEVRLEVHSIGLRPGGGRRTVWSSLAWAARPAAPCESFRFGGAA